MWSIMVHGGAWAIPDERAAASEQGCVAAAAAAEAILKAGGTALDAVEAAVMCLEDNPEYDAGFGSVLTAAGTIEMDSMIMDGRTLGLGAVACVSGVKNPVSLARKVMEKTSHVLLVGDGAARFAESQGVPLLVTEQLMTPAAKAEFELHKSAYGDAVMANFNHGHDTVGAVARDMNGHVACATSTGGITGKMLGRVGDSPLVGSGGYADDAIGAVSSTGHGEGIAKSVLCARVLWHVENGRSANESAEQCLRQMAARLGSRGGLIVVDKDGNFGRFATTEKMAWASAQQLGEAGVVQRASGCDNRDVFLKM